MTITPSALFADILSAYLEDLSEAQAQSLERSATVSMASSTPAKVPGPGKPPLSFACPSLSLARRALSTSSSTTTSSIPPSTNSSRTLRASHLAVPRPHPRPIPSMDYFCAEAEPPITFQKYIQRLLQYFRCSPECFVLLVVYLRRAVYQKEMFLTTKNVHRLCLVGLLLAVKQREDIYYSMKYYASVGGVQVRDLMDMELKFFADVLQYAGHVEEEEYRAALEAMTASYQARQLSSGSGLLMPTSTLPSTTHHSMHHQRQESGHVVAPSSTLHVPGKGMPSRVASCATSCGLSGNASPASEAMDLAAPPNWVLECGLFW